MAVIFYLDILKDEIKNTILKETIKPTKQYFNTEFIRCLLQI